MGKLKTFLSDGLSIKEALIIIACVLDLLVFIINSIFLFHIAKLATIENIQVLLPIFLDFIKISAIYNVIPFTVIICFFFLNNTTADVIKTFFTHKFNNNSSILNETQNTNTTPSEPLNNNFNNNIPPN